MYACNRSSPRPSRTVLADGAQQQGVDEEAGEWQANADDEHESEKNRGVHDAPASGSGWAARRTSWARRMSCRPQLKACPLFSL